MGQAVAHLEDFERQPWSRFYRRIDLCVKTTLACNRVRAVSLWLAQEYTKPQVSQVSPVTCVPYPNPSLGTADKPDKMTFPVLPVLMKYLSRRYQKCKAGAAQ